MGDRNALRRSREWVYFCSVQKRYGNSASEAIEEHSASYRASFYRRVVKKCEHYFVGSTPTPGGLISHSKQNAIASSAQMRPVRVRNLPERNRKIIIWVEAKPRVHEQGKSSCDETENARKQTRHFLPRYPCGLLDSKSHLDVVRNPCSIIQMLLIESLDE
jgi:hypothetical protein